MGTIIQATKYTYIVMLSLLTFLLYSDGLQAQDKIIIEAEDTTENRVNIVKILSGLTADPSKGTHLILYRQSKRELEEPIKFKINGEKYKFEPYSSLAIQTDSLNNEVQICFDRKYLRCRKYSIAPGKKKYLKFSQKKGKAPTLKEVNEIDGENHSMRAAAQQRKREEAKREVEQ